MRQEPFYCRILEIPWLYRIIQQVLSQGGEADLQARIVTQLARLPAAASILDVGCGPRSWLWAAGLQPVGLDISAPYSLAYRASGQPAVTASAAALPFGKHTFDAVWCIGMLHHLPDAAARQAVAEMLRVTDPGGYCMIFDAVLPEPPLSHPLAWMIRRLDRGAFMRRESELKNLLPAGPWQFKRCHYAWWHPEGLFCFHA